MAEAPPALLVVDDSAFNRLLLQRRLAELGYPAPEMAENGRQGLAAIAARRFDAVLLDLEMPELDGIGVLEALHGRPDAPPVIVISAHTGMEGVIRCIELGAEDYLPKSFDPPLLRARLSAVLEKKRLRDLAAERLAALEAELASARQAQLSLVPREVGRLARGRISLAAHMEPARQVGGDLYEALPLGQRHLLFGVADVAGKGAPAGLTMARSVGLIRAAARAAIARGEVPDPGLLLQAVNDELAADNPEMTFVTACLGLLDAETGEGLIALAGHDAPCLVAGTAAQPLAGLSAQPALGVIEGLAYAAQPFALRAGERLFLFTDGITEADAPDGGFYGMARMQAALAAAGPGAEGLVLAVLRDLEGFVAGAAQADDITMLAIGFG